MLHLVFVMRKVKANRGAPDVKAAVGIENHRRTIPVTAAVPDRLPGIKAFVVRTDLDIFRFIASFDGLTRWKITARDLRRKKLTNDEHQNKIIFRA